MSENKNRQTTSISKAQTLEEIGEFWDTHSLDDYWEETREVEFEVRAKQRNRTSPEPPKKESNALVVCVKTDDKDLLIIGKIYSIKILNGKRIAVKDEAGETVICPKDDFLIVEFQPKIEKKLRELITV